MARTARRAARLERPARTKRRYHRMDDLTAWRITALGRSGWFSHRFIAAEAMGIPLDRVTEADVKQVTRTLLEAGVYVSLARAGLTMEAKIRAVEIGRRARRRTG